MFEPNPQGEALSALAREMAAGLIYGRGGRFSGPGRLAQLRDAQREAEKLDASRDYLTRLEHLIKAVGVLDGGKRVVSLREAQGMLEHDLPRMTTSADWPGARAQQMKAAAGAY